MFDKELHIIPWRFTARRMERRRKKKTASEPREMESSKEEMAETMGKEKGKERRGNVSTKSQNHQTWEHGLNNLGAQKLTLRVGVTMIGTLQI